MTRRKTSRRWLSEHRADQYVQRATREGGRSRAIFKLEQIDARDGLLKPGMTVIDLGSAPGGWSQYAARRVGPTGTVIALDLLPMEPIAGVVFLQGDFREPSSLDRLTATLSGRRADLVMSDMAPNLSGVKSSDQARAMALLESALEFARGSLQSGGAFLVKMFHGRGSEEYVRELRRSFAKVLIRKPDASRARSAEVYVLARNYHV